MIKNKNELINLFNDIERRNHLFFGVAIKKPDLDKPEIIINHFDNFANKKQYYINEYDDNLVCKTNSNIKIVDAFSSDYVSDIVLYLFE